MSKELLLDLEVLDNWYTEHFEELVDNYAGRVVAVVEGQVVAVTETQIQADQLARQMYPNAIPFVISVPTEEDLLCLL